MGGILLIVALLAFGLGVLQQSRAERYDPNVVRCGDDIMSRGDTCLDFSGDGGGDYDEMQAQQDANNETGTSVGRISLIVAPVTLALAVLLFAVGIGKRVSQRNATRRAPPASDSTL